MAFKKSKQPKAVADFEKQQKKKKKSPLFNVPDKSYKGALTK